VVLSRKADIMKLEAEGEDGMMHSVLSQLPAMVADGQHSSELDINPQSTPRLGRNTSAAHSTTIIPSSRQSTSRSSSRSARDASPNPTEVNSNSNSGPNATTLSEEAKTSGNLPSESVRALSPVPSEARSTVATTLADPTSRATTPSPDSESRLEASPSETDEKAGLRAEAAPPSKTGSEEVPISSLLRAADELYEKYPPTHSSIAADTIMGPKSVIFTWHEKDHTERTVDEEPCLPSDDEAEKMVEDKSQVVLPYDPMDDAPPAEKEPPKKQVARRKPRNPLQSTLTKSLDMFLKLDKRTILAGVVAVVAIGIAAYDARSSGKLRQLANKAGIFLLYLASPDGLYDVVGNVLPSDPDEFSSD
ncbi:hypothetical protein FRC01_014102, partial [Tulasnella sp. 417]